MSQAERIHAIVLYLLFTDDEMAFVVPPPDHVRVQGIAQDFGFDATRLKEKKPEILALIKEIVVDTFLKTKGGGWSFLNLCVNRAGEQWGDHPNCEELYVIAAGAGLAGTCMPREFWAMLPGGMPYIWFDNVGT